MVRGMGRRRGRYKYVWWEDWGGSLVVAVLLSCFFVFDLRGNKIFSSFSFVLLFIGTGRESWLLHTLSLLFGNEAVSHQLLVLLFENSLQLFNVHRVVALVG